VSQTFTGRPKQFLADLTMAMRSAAEAGRLTTIEQSRSTANEYVENLRATAVTGQASIRETLAEDVAQLRDQGKAQAQLIREESERRIGRRREILDGELAEYGQAVASEVRRVQKQVAEFEEELARFYSQLSDETDPTVFASMAAQMPDLPEYGEADPAQLVRDARATAAPVAAPAPATAGAPAETAEPRAKAALPDHWWLDSPTSIASRPASGNQ
jgi:hypothetical protein